MGDYDLIAERHRDPAVVGREADETVELRKLALPPEHGLRLCLRTLRGRQRLVERLDPPEQGTELEASEDLLQPRAIRRSQDERVRIDVELEIAPHGRKHL